MPNTLLVGYDLKQGENYEELIDYLKSLDNWWHHLDSTWLVVTSQTASELMDELKRLVNGGDKVVVVNVTDDLWASLGLSDKGNDWLRKYVHQ
jgi:hypothetical protein